MSPQGASEPRLSSAANAPLGSDLWGPPAPLGLPNAETPRMGKTRQTEAEDHTLLQGEGKGNIGM